MSERFSWVALLRYGKSDPRRCAATKRRWLLGYIGTAVLGVIAAVSGTLPAMTQAPSPPAPESARSSPPDTTPYARPAIPEDRLRTPLSNPTDTDTPSPTPKDSNGTAPEPLRHRDMGPSRDSRR
jgi:hypothetical protein